jgi:Flp pilus assembly pilin Flp
LEVRMGLMTGPIRFRAWTSRLPGRYRSAEGATAIEYAFMAALIAAVIVLAVTEVGVSTSRALCSVLPGLNTACP